MFRNVLLMFPVLLQRCFYHLFGQRFECIVHMVSQFLNALQRFAIYIYVLLHFLFLFFKSIFSRFPPWQLHRLHVIRPHRCRPSTVGRHQKPQLFSAVFPPWQLHRFHVIRPHRCRPSTVGRHQKPQLFSAVFPPWQLHRFHVIRPHRCRPSTVGRHQKPQLFSAVFLPWQLHRCFWHPPSLQR